MKDKRVIKSHEDVAKSVEFNLIDTTNCVYRESTPVDYFYKQNGVSSDDGKDCVAVVDPLYMLLNQKRINNMASIIGEENAKQWFDAMAEHSSNDALAELRKQCSDTDLLSLLKPRNIQHPSEIDSWAKYMSSNMSYFKSEVERVRAERIAEAKAKEEAIKTNVESKATE